MSEYPSTLAEAVDTLLSTMEDKDLKYLMSQKKEDLIMLHHGFGTSIRNEFGLWKGNDELVKNCCGPDDELHPDTASMKIIEAAWDTLKSGEF